MKSNFLYPVEMLIRKGVCSVMDVNQANEVLKKEKVEWVEAQFTDIFGKVKISHAEIKARLLRMNQLFKRLAIPGMRLQERATRQEQQRYQGSGDYSTMQFIFVQN